MCGVEIRAASNWSLNNANAISVFNAVRRLIGSHLKNCAELHERRYLSRETNIDLSRLEISFFLSFFEKKISNYFKKISRRYLLFLYEFLYDIYIIICYFCYVSSMIVQTGSTCTQSMIDILSTLLFTVTTWFSWKKYNLLHIFFKSNFCIQLWRRQRLLYNTLHLSKINKIFYKLYCKKRG